MKPSGPRRKKFSAITPIYLVSLLSLAASAAYAFIAVMHSSRMPTTEGPSDEVFGSAVNELISFGMGMKKAEFEREPVTVAPVRMTRVRNSIISFLQLNATTVEWFPKDSRKHKQRGLLSSISALWSKPQSPSGSPYLMVHLAHHKTGTAWFSRLFRQVLASPS